MPHLVHGVRVPDRVAGHPGLELCNTRANWAGAAEHEYLHSATVLAVWAVDGGLLPTSLLRAAIEHPSTVDDDDPDGVVAAAKTARAAIYRCALDTPQTPAAAADWDVVTGAVAAAREVAVLRRPTPSAPGTWTLAPAAVTAVRTVEDVARLGLHAAALAAEDLLRTASPGDVHACPGVGCGWLFLDPRHRRRWCTMAVCGNRAKVRRHAARSRGPEPERLDELA